MMEQRLNRLKLWQLIFDVLTTPLFIYIGYRVALIGWGWALKGDIRWVLAAAVLYLDRWLIQQKIKRYQI